MRNDVILNKMATIERCIKRIHEEYAGNPANLENYTKQDSIILNIQRACEASIDIAMHIVSLQKLGIPQTSRDAFEFLANHRIIPADVSFKMKAMIGFRNIVVHDYQSINLEIVQKIIENHLGDYTSFLDHILAYEA
ncbi:type VII toxin-antitoxin system HepT family RNase toxin [Ectobacillus ponti]|uniref:DUF86 domain-containing protein n=1 Tax=Ectobacillus ponti TaxID=2961894 RepID=A0AA42BQP6_9BACI|nr:DUF86 domain-containing protein [Ectobacillus ponti]MCP8970107.1 DUF86 domain-containing protein [Ectobacillus ponti]